MIANNMFLVFNAVGLSYLSGTVTDAIYMLGLRSPSIYIYLGVDWRSLRRTGPTVNKSWD